MADDPIVSFYSGGRDERGRTVEAILGWPDRMLEATHDYIQWLFPTRAASAFNPFAPLVTDETARAFASRPELRDRLSRALDRMLTFYGLARRDSDDGAVRITIDGERFDARAAVWLTPHNHNHLRLTRIMQSLSALGLEPAAVALQQCLLGEVRQSARGTAVSSETVRFWQSAC